MIIKNRFLTPDTQEGLIFDTYMVMFMDKWTGVSMPWLRGADEERGQDPTLKKGRPTAPKPAPAAAAPAAKAPAAAAAPSAAAPKASGGDAMALPAPRSQVHSRTAP